MRIGINQMTHQEIKAELRRIVQKHGPTNVASCKTEILNEFGSTPAICWDSTGKMFMGMLHDPRAEYHGKTIAF